MSTPHQDLISAASRNDLFAVYAVLANGISEDDLNQADDSGKTALYWGVVFDNVQVVRALVDANANISGSDVRIEIPTPHVLASVGNSLFFPYYLLEFLP